VRLLAAERPVGAQLHHLLGHDPAVLQVIGQLGIPYDVHVHDSAAFCPRVGLLGPDRRYCGEPEIAGCEACIADIGRKDGLDIPVAELRRRSAGILGAALRVLVPSQDTAMRINRHFPAVKPVMVPHGDDAAIADPPAPRPVLQGGGRSICRVAVIGAIGLEKGYEVLLACARDAAWRDLPVEFVVIGHSIDDKRLLATGRVFVTGEYRAQEAVGLIRAQQASIAWVTSIWPETWCFTLTEAWQAGLQAACFDIGAPAERIRRSGRGLVLPLGLPAGSINHALVAATSLASG
jgi:glycosyltransferase involved in cell wall biosynthesis